MKRKITFLARAPKWGGFGARGLANLVMPSAAWACREKNSLPRSPVRATDAKPPPISQRNSCRVRPQNWRRVMRSIQVEELVQVVDEEAEALECLGLARAFLSGQRTEENDVLVDFLRRRFARQGEAKGESHPSREVPAGLPAEPFGEARGLAVEEVAVQGRQRLGRHRRREPPRAARVRV